MYKKQLTLFATLLCIIAVSISMYIGHVSDKDRQEYQQLLDSSTPKPQSLLTYSEQVREKVCKEVWYQDTSPLCFRVESHDSELFFFHQKGEIEVVEELGNMRCWMQEELYYDKDTGKPMQILHYIEAEHGCYHYNTQLFVAQEAQLWKYCLEGHEPIFNQEGLKPLMSGTAQVVEFTIKEKKINFQARQFRAKFTQKESVK